MNSLFLFKMSKKYFKIFLLIVFLLAIGLIIFEYKKGKKENIKQEENIFANNNETINNEEKKEENIPEVKTESIKEKIPEKILINVPFLSQAPYGKWDEYHEEACEEASIIMLKYFLDKNELNPEIAEKEIQALIKFQNKKYGDYKDSNAKQIVQMYNDFYGNLPDNLELKVIYDFKKEDIKKYLSRGYPIIIPAAGRLLKNPYFTPPGPLYHNLVLIGYENSEIITNDPGTKRGEKYKYKLDILYNSIHDFPGKKEDIEKGRKAMVVLE